MGENVAINVDFWGRGQAVSTTSVLCIQSDVTWPDFRLLLKLTFQCEEVIIQYFDEENDAVMIRSQEELEEAMKLGKKTGNTLRVRLTESYPQPAENEQTDGQKLTAEVVADAAMMDASAGGGAQEGRKKDVPLAINFSAAQNETEETGERMHTDDSGSSPSSPTEASLAKRHRVKGYYSRLARDVGCMRGKIVRTCSRMQRHLPSSQYDSESGEQSPASDIIAPPPPMWFQQYMDKFKEELSAEVADRVARRTVKQILSGLDGAVIHSVQGTSGRPTPAVLPDPGADGQGQAIYCHTGIVCDCCDQTIVGNRYKCGNCDDYDLCEQCESIDGIHNPTHVFIKIKRPAVTAGRKKGQMQPLLRKSLYSPEEADDEDKMKEAKKLERMQERDARLAERCRRREEKQEEKLKKKEDKLKRRHEHQRDVPHKKERLDLPKYRLKDRPDAQFIRDETISDGTQMPSGTKFTKKWLMKNTGGSAWDRDTQLSFLWGNLPPKSARNAVPHLQPQEEGILSVQLVAPEEPGVYQNHWRLQQRGYSFGHRVWCSIVVQQRSVLEPASQTVPELCGIVTSASAASEAEPGVRRREVKRTEDDGSESWQCPFCAVTVTYKHGNPLVSHLMRQHADLMGDAVLFDQIFKEIYDQPSQDCVRIQPASEKAEAPAAVQCPFCPTSLVSTNLFRLHLNNKHPEMMSDMVEREKESGEARKGLDTQHSNVERDGQKDNAEEQQLEAAAADQIETNVESGETTVCNTDRQVLSPCKELLSFEMLEISEGQGQRIPRASQTATPNNTPLDMSPPKSPIPELDLAAACRLSNSSSLELVTESPTGENDLDLMSALVQERMAALGLKPGQGECDIDIESISSCSDESDATENDFFIVPLPECFNTSIPLTRSVMSPGATCGSASNTVSDCSSERSIDDMLTTSNTIPMTPLTPAVALQPDIKIENEEQSFSDASEDDEVPDGETGTITEGVKGIELNGETSSVADAVARIELNGETGSITDAVARIDLSDDELYEAAGPEPVVPEHDVKTETVENDETGETVTKEPEVVKEEPVVVENEEPKEEAEEGAEGPGMSGDDQGRSHAGAGFMHTAIGMASVAATQAYHTAKDVFQTLQANNKFVPPKSDWKPPQDNWTPPKSTWNPPKNDWTPPQTTWTAPQSAWSPPEPEPVPRESSPMEQLVEMGFADRDVNRKLLEKYNGNLEKVVSELLQQGENDWHVHRH